MNQFRTANRGAQQQQQQQQQQRHPQLQQQQQQQPVLRSMLFQLISAEQIHIAPGNSFAGEPASYSRLLVLPSGLCKLDIDGVQLPLLAEGCYLLEPGATFLLEGDSHEPLVFKLIGYRCHIVESEPGCNSDQEPAPASHSELVAGPQQEPRPAELLQALPFNQLVFMQPRGRMLQLAEQMTASDGGLPGTAASELGWLRRQLALQEFMIGLLESGAIRANEQHPVQLVARTIEYMHSHYRDNLAIKALAQSVGMAQWQYNAIFKELTSTSPLAYLTELRIQAARKLLAVTDEPLREISRQAGFADEYYFNRRFRQSTGVTPRQYARSVRIEREASDLSGNRVRIPSYPQRILYYGDAIGDLLSLGIEPVGGCRRMFGNSLAADESRTLPDVGDPFSLEKGRALRPDLIIFDHYDKKLLAEAHDVAPAMAYNSRIKLEDRMAILGEWLGKQTEANRWINRYRYRSALMWRKLRPVLKRGETASVFIYDRGGQLFVMGTLGLAAMLYHPLGFAPGKRSSELVRANQPYRPITIAELADYAGDHVFLLMPTEPASRRMTERLLASPQWARLPARESGRAHLIAGKWNMADAYTQDKLLDAFPTML